jgi:hypothetical protein
VTGGKSAAFKTGPRHATPADTSKAVAAFMLALDHPFRKEIEVLRRVILGAHPSIAEGIKWNAPSFRTTEYFATFHLRAKDGIGVILHLGAKARAAAAPPVHINDPGGLLQWLGKDRAMVTFADAQQINAKRRLFATVVKEWIRFV